jgi:hypothetical protein
MTQCFQARENLATSERNTDMWKSEQKNMLAALRAPGAVPAKHPMRIEKADDGDEQSM